MPQSPSSPKRLLQTAIFALVGAALPLGILAGCERPSGTSGPPTVADAGATPPEPALNAAKRDDDDDDERPYADMSRTVGTVTSIPIRGRLIKVEGAPDLRSSTPFKEISQDELKRTDFDVVVLGKDGAERMKLGAAKSDEEGYVDVAFAVNAGALEPGLHKLEIRVKGAPAGRTGARLLDGGHAGAVVRSDIDLTYLDTHFRKKSDMLALLKQNAAERKTLPGMEKVYQALRAGASGTEDRPLIFISGSPRFFKRVLEARMDVDGVAQDGVVLKAFDEVVKAKAIALDFDGIAPALKEQVGYKMGAVLSGRLDLPKTAPEILMGDDSEADFVVYSIYHRAMIGELDPENIGKELTRAGVRAELKDPLVDLAGKVRASLGSTRPVKLIYINLTGSPNAVLKIEDWPAPDVMRYHRGAWPLILDLYEEGLVSKEAAGAVRARLLELGKTQKDLDDAANEGVKSGLLKRETTSLR